MFPLFKTEKIIEKKGGKVCEAQRCKGPVVRKEKRQGISIQYLESLPCFADSEPSVTGRQAGKTVLFNAAILELLEQTDPLAKNAFFDLALAFEKARIAGKGEKQAYWILCDRFLNLSSKTQNACMQALKNPQLDPGGVFHDFLQACMLRQEKEKERLIALCKARALVDIPYDRQRAYEVEKRFEGDLPVLRMETLNVLANTYDVEVDKRNARRVFESCLENGKRLLVCRFGRAFYTDALLIADSKGIRSCDVKSEIDRLQKDYKKLESFHGMEKIGPEFQRVLNLASGEWFPLAGIRGALEKLKDGLRGLETGFVRQGEQTGDFSKARAVRSLVDEFRKNIVKMEKRMEGSDPFEPAFVSFVSRIHELDAINVVRVNELLDPFFGENPKMESLIINTGHNTTISPNPRVWLPFAGDWVEALPAYAHYTIMPTQGSGYKVVALTEREVLEIIYKTCADDWARNIEDVMARENAAVARRLVAERGKVKSGDEATDIAFLRQKKKVREAAVLAAQIEDLADKEVLRVARLQEQGKSREEALYEIAGTRGKKLKTADDHPRADFYSALVVQKKRPLPNANVLTTLGPTETETNIIHWLEEAMSLYVIETRHGLAEDVRKKMAETRAAVGEMAVQVIAEEELQGELLKMLGEQGLRDEPANRARIALALAGTYPEIAVKINRMIAGKYGIKGSFSHCLRDYVGPLAVFTARREMVREKGLSRLLDDGRYRYASSGPYKRYHLAYTPSRVDLGPEIIESVRNVPKWVGGDGNEAARSAKSLYSLFNVAGVTAVNRPQIAEFLKVGENFFTRGGVYYLSLTAGSNLNTLGVGDFEFLRGEWNRRGDRTVLPTGETYGGFCVPKEFSLLFAIITRALNPDTVNEILDGFGIPQEEDLRRRLMDDLLELLKMRRETPDTLAWEEKAAGLLKDRYRIYLPLLPQLAKMLNKVGVLYEDPETRSDYEITDWKNKKALGMEEINRSGVFDKVRMIHLLAKEAAAQSGGASMDHLVGVIGAGYKEDVTDVRFSSGARKLEVFAGLSLHLLQDIDPDGRAIYGRVFSQYPAPLDVRMVGLCTAKDMFGHVPMDFSPFAEEARKALRSAGYSDAWIAQNIHDHALDLDEWGWKSEEDKKRVAAQVMPALPFLVFGNNLAQISESVKRRFLNAGMCDETIPANAASFGGDIRCWKGLPEDAKKRLDREVGAARHVFVTEARGIFSKERYEAALRGADFVDLGIPDKELLGLIDRLPELVFLMKNGKEKPLLFADGTSGARRSAIGFRYPTAKEKVKELFALDDRIHYGCMGTGREEIQGWKQEMNNERGECRRLLAAVLEHRMNNAEAVYAGIVKRWREEEKEEEYIRQEMFARQFHVWSPFYRYASERVSKVVHGLTLAQLDFGAFLVLGGRWIFNGKVTRDEFEQTREDYVFALKQKTIPAGVPDILSHSFQPKYRPEEEDFKEVSTGVSGSLKAVEEMAMKLETREIRRRQLEQALRINRRRTAFQEATAVPGKGPERDYEEALSQIALSGLSEEKFGAFLALTKKVWVKVVQEFTADESFKSQCLQELDSTFRGGVLLDTEYASLARKGARLFGNGERPKNGLKAIALALELLDIANLVEKVLYVEKGMAVWKAVARFFDQTINNHIFDYVPYHYHAERTPTFKNWSRGELIEFAVERHAFLHRLILDLLRSQSTAADKPEETKDKMFGRLAEDGSMEFLPLAVNVSSPAEQRWFSYARLRDLATLVFDGYPLPEIRENLEMPEGVCIGIIYPIGNTTVSVALEQGPRLSARGIHVVLCPFPEIVEQSGRKMLKARDIFFRNPDGEWTLARLKSAADVHAVWFHFTHFLRPEIEKVKAPLIQPLLWEAATYLKCALPGMMKGSGYSCPDQRNWMQAQSAGTSEDKAMSGIRSMLHELAARHRVLIVKAEKESGGRRSKILPVRDKEGRFLEANITGLAGLIYEISQTDNAVVQEVIPSRVKRLYSPSFLSALRDRFITELGIGIQEDTPFFSYFRLIVVKQPDGKFRITHRITVVSTAGIANVGQGGRLFEYRDEKIDPMFREDLREELEGIAFASLRSQERYIAENRKEILDSYLEVHKEFAFEREILEPHQNLLGVPDNEILFEMGDYMPVLLVDDQDRINRVYSHEAETFVPVLVNGKPNPRLAFFDAKGRRLKPPICLFENSEKRKIFWQYGKGKKQPARALTVVKIEPNPGAGLWRPHNDRLKLVGRDGEGVFQIFEVLGEWGKRYKEAIM